LNHTLKMDKFDWESDIKIVILEKYNQKVSTHQIYYFCHKTSFDPTNLQNYSLEQLYDFCISPRSAFRFFIIAAIIKVLSIDSEDAQKYLKEFEQKYLSVIRSIDIAKSINLDDQPKEVQSVKQLVTSHFLNLLDVVNNVEELYEGLQKNLKGINIGRKIPICASILRLQNRNELADMLIEYFESKKLPPWQQFQQESKWKKELIDEIYPVINKRIENNSSYADVRIHGAMNRIVDYLRMFENYIQECQKPTTHNILQWFFGTCTFEGLVDAFVHIGENYIEPLNHLVRSKISLHHASDFVKVMVPFFRDYIPHYFMCKSNLSLLKGPNILMKIKDKRKRPVETRRNFFDSEITSLLEAVDNDPKWKTIFLILHEVGLRAGAIGTMKIKTVVTPNGIFFDEINHIEKQQKQRTFIVSSKLKQAFREYCEFKKINYVKDQEEYLFKNEKNNNRLSKAAICVKLHDIADKCGIKGMHVHPHAFRHTIVNNLMTCGNKLENVSRFIGHSSVSTTETYYWTTELRNIVPTMNIPWLLTAKKKIAYPEDLSSDESDFEENVENVETSTVTSVIDREDLMQIAIGLLSAMQSVLTIEQKQTLKDRIPNIEQMFALICEHSITSSTTS